MRVLDVIAVDDGARRYRVACIESQPDGNRLEGAFALAPAIPREVRRLTLTIGTVRDEGGQRERLPGPWVFPIPLAPKGPQSSEPPLGPRAARAADAVRDRPEEP